MDKITFESVMEEIKKSLGEARLMKISEDDEADKTETGTGKRETPIGGRRGAISGIVARAEAPATQAAQAQVARDDATEKNRISSINTDSTDVIKNPSPTPGVGRASSVQPPETKASPEDRQKFQQKSVTPPSAPAPSNNPPQSAKQDPSTVAGPADRQAFRDRTGSTVGKTAAPAAPATSPTPSVKSGVGGGLGFNTQGATSGGKTVAPSTTSSTPSAPAAKTQAAPKAPSAPRASAPAAVDTAAIYKKHGVGGSDEDSGAFHRAEAEIAAARKGNAGSTPSAPVAKAPSAPAAPRPQVSGASAPSASAARPTVSAPRPVSQGSAAQATPKSTPSSSLSSLSSSGQAMAKQYSGKVGTDSSGNTPTDEPTSASKNYTPVTPAMKSGFRDALYRKSDKNTTTTNNLPYNPNKPSTTVTRPASMQENFDQFVKKFLKESR
jgi:hypothetical protein